MSYAFSFDASACTGCKACQVACKDKNSLPIGLLWRRVVEVSGGEWRQAGDAWENDVFAYNLSLACNHCTHPKCAGVCPVDAFVVRPDGIVLIDGSRCMGCGYCAWACPYGAPQYNSSLGVMTKCDFCFDAIDAGLPPSCVAACPLRVLDIQSLEESNPPARRLNLWQMPGTDHPFPLPDFSRTEPHLAIKLHAGMDSPLEKVVSNLEEVLPPRSNKVIHQGMGSKELPLVGFTLLVQMAAGMAIFSPLLAAIPVPVLLSIGLLLVSGGLISFLHLGRKRNAWRSVIHLKKSWLSREILLALLLGIAWVITTSSLLVWKISPNPWPLALSGFALVYSMSRVYLLRAVPAWNTWHTPLQFFASAAVLGALGMYFASPQPGWIIIAGAGLGVELGLTLNQHGSARKISYRLRLALLGLGMMGLFITATLSQPDKTWLVVPVFLVILASEIMGRWLFYTRRVPFPMHATQADMN